jgi:hypothetical protein
LSAPGLKEAASTFPNKIFLRRYHLNTLKHEKGKEDLERIAQEKITVRSERHFISGRERASLCYKAPRLRPLILQIRGCKE